MLPLPTPVMNPTKPISVSLGKDAHFISLSIDFSIPYYEKLLMIRSNLLDSD